MKKQLFLYLFLLTALMLLFVFVNTKKEMKSYEDKITKLKTFNSEQNNKYQDTIANLRIEAMELGKFTLEEDAYAIEHLYKEGIDYKELIPHVEDQLISLNIEEGGNPLVPYAPMFGDKMMINSTKMLNHKWIIADFSDGKYWGQVLIACTYNEDKTISFNTKDSFLYPIDVIE
ncbi:MAG: hydrolase [Flavobacteriaceae bacterium]